MTHQSTNKVAVIVPNWNGYKYLPACLDSLLAQSIPTEIIVVENGSTDGSLELLQTNYPLVTVLPQPKNLGFAGGVNVGLRYALDNNLRYAALFNNDAVADRHWLKHLVESLESHQDAGIATCKFMTIDRSHLDSTGDTYTTWGLPYPRGRGETDLNKYDAQTDIFGASGGASLYRCAMFKEIGLFDEDFFAYYEDVDLSFRAQLAGWKVIYNPKAMAYHQIGGTSGKIKGFTTYQTLKNLPLVWFKNVPTRFFWKIGWRLMLAQTLFLGRAISRGQGWSALKGACKCLVLIGQKVSERQRIQKAKMVSDEYLWDVITHDLPPNANALRSLRAKWRKLTGHKS